MSAELTWFDPEQVWLDAALRGRAARRTRALLRRALPVFVRSPRWSDPQRFLEELALDLAVGEPPVGCRRVALRHLKGAPAPRARLEVLRVLMGLARPDSLLPPPVPGDRRGFRSAITELVGEAIDTVPYASAILFSEVEHLPVEVGEDLVAAWQDLVAARAPEPCVSLLLTSSAETAWAEPLVRVDLSDFGESEAAVEITRRAGRIEPAALRSASVLSGGVPAIIDSLAPFAHAGALDPDEMLGRLPIADELRGAVDIVCMQPRLGARLADLVDGVKERDDDDALLYEAGLARATRDRRHTELRSPLVAHLV